MSQFQRTEIIQLYRKISNNIILEAKPESLIFKKLELGEIQLHP